MILHLSQFGNCIIPLSGIIAPIVIWQLKKDEMPSIDEHGRNVVNWMISAFIYSLICIPLIFLVIGVPMLIILAIVNVIFVIIGSIKAYDGVAWKYPLSFKIF